MIMKIIVITTTTVITILGIMAITILLILILSLSIKTLLNNYKYYNIILSSLLFLLLIV